MQWWQQAGICFTVNEDVRFRLLVHTQRNTWGYICVCVCVCVHCTASRGTENARANPKISCPCLRHDGKLGSRGTAPFTINLGTRCNWVVTFTPRVLYSPGYTQKYLLNRTVWGGGEAQRKCGRFGKRTVLSAWRIEQKNELKVTLKKVLRGN